jgi:protein gp37
MSDLFFKGKRSWSKAKHQCEAAGVSFFFKQWGGVRKEKAGRELLGQTWDEMPASFTQSFK